MKKLKINYDTTYYVIAMLKKYNIKNIVASPGTQNAKFNMLVQNDIFFNCYSVVDERSAAYVASGIAFETGEPVVITCTEATASRNYVSALTDAYYKKIPIIALTFFNTSCNKFNLSAQFIDRSVTQNDIKSLSVKLPKVKDINDKKNCLDSLNAALATAKFKKEPVHINCPAFLDMNDLYNTLPTDIWNLDYYKSNFSEQKENLKNKNVMVFIGSHYKFSKEEHEKLENFVSSWNMPVVCDHTANYHGINKILTSQLYHLTTEFQYPDIVIDIGKVCGEYASSKTFGNAKVWRVTDEDKFTFRYSKPVEKFFNCCEKYFFEEMINNEAPSTNYYSALKNKIDEIVLPEIPFSTLFVAKNLCKYIPENSSLHLAILNSLRSANFYNLDKSIDVNCNVGGFGIDGALSTSVGQSLANNERKIFCLIGDLAFFYDMNILGNRDIGKNLRIIVINNNRGEEFRLNPALERHLGDKTDKLIAAAGHYKNGVKNWGESCGLHYMSADNKESLSAQIQDFCTKDYDKSVIFEIFTKNGDEQSALNAYRKKTKPATKTVKKGLIYRIKKIIKG